MRQIVSLMAAAALLWGTAGAETARADEPAFLAASAGGFDINDDDTSIEFRLEYRSDYRLWHIGPMIGLMANTDGGVYGYGGLFLDIFLGKRWVVMPNAAVGGYRRGDSKNLGSILEFRTGVEIAYRFEDKSRLGLAFQHISNAGIDDENQGTESLVLTYAIPFN